MQLIVETASDIDIKNKMSTLEDAVNEKNLFNDIQRFETDDTTNCKETEHVVEDTTSEHVQEKKVLERIEDKTEITDNFEFIKENNDDSLNLEQNLDNGILEKDISLDNNEEIIKKTNNDTDDAKTDIDRVINDSTGILQNDLKRLVAEVENVSSNNLPNDCIQYHKKESENSDNSENIILNSDPVDKTEINQVKEISNGNIDCDVKNNIDTESAQITKTVTEVQQSKDIEFENLSQIEKPTDQKCVADLCQSTTEKNHDDENTNIIEKDISSNLTTDSKKGKDINSTTSSDSIIENKADLTTDNTLNNICLEQQNELVCKNTELIDDDDDSRTKLVTVVNIIEENNQNNNSSDNIDNNMEVVDVSLNDNVEVLQEKAESTTSHVIDMLGEEIMDLGQVGDTDEIVKPVQHIPSLPKEDVSKSVPPKSRLSNTLDILSDDEEEVPYKADQIHDAQKGPEKQCIDLEEDDDIMVIEEDSNSKDSKPEIKSDSDCLVQDVEQVKMPNKVPGTSNISDVSGSPERSTSPIEENGGKDPENHVENKSTSIKESEKPLELNEQIKEKKPLLPSDFLSTCKKNMSDMTRADLEDFCIMKIVESVVDRSSLSEIKSRLKIMSKNIEDHKKRAVMITKQNRDLQVVLKSIQEEQKKKGPGVIPLKITRSVGMQIHMVEPNSRKKNAMNTAPLVNSNNNTKISNTPNLNNKISRCSPSQNPRLHKQLSTPPQIPVPRLVPAANNNVSKSPTATTQVNTNNNVTKTTSSANNSPVSNGIKNTTAKPEKRTFSRVQSMTVDLTDDEPPAKVTTRSGTVAPVRVVPQQNLLAPGRSPQFAQQTNNPRKVYIPISAPQAQNVRPGQIMLKSVVPQGTRQRLPNQAIRQTLPPAPVRMPRTSSRHPAPLPDAMKQYQPPNWKAIPPAPDLKLSKVENGIVISWKIEDFQEDTYEEIASYQLYAYQETSSPPNTNLWKKIGDVKALPLPMACTLTQFMAGYRYYFAVRAVDIRSRLGTFSLPGSILLLSKTINGTAITTKINP